MKKLLIRRILAGMIDYSFVMIYALLLLTVFSWVYSKLQIDISGVHPLRAQILGFLTLTFPVFLYFFLMERDIGNATYGKRFLKIKIKPGNVFWRNLLKLLPWEMAHAGVHWLMFYEQGGREYPLWVWLLLFVAQMITFLYWASILLSKGKSSLYDRWSSCGIRLSQGD
ncbi:hypothetical protein GCM10028791_36350 [Echinicola sediminis]